MLRKTPTKQPRSFHANKAEPHPDHPLLCCCPAPHLRCCVRPVSSGMRPASASCRFASLSFSLAVLYGFAWDLTCLRACACALSSASFFVLRKGTRKQPSCCCNENIKKKVSYTCRYVLLCGGWMDGWMVWPATRADFVVE